MLKDYRRRFVMSIMFLAGLALLIVFVVIGVVSVRNEWSRLKDTMEIVISPWESPGENFRTFDLDDRTPADWSGSIGQEQPGDENPDEEHGDTGRMHGEPGDIPPEPPSGSSACTAPSAPPSVSSFSFPPSL